MRHIPKIRQIPELRCINFVKTWKFLNTKNIRAMNDTVACIYSYVETNYADLDCKTG